MQGFVKRMKDDDLYKDGLLVFAQEGNQGVEIFYPEGSDECVINCYTYMPDGEQFVYTGIPSNTGHDKLIEYAEELLMEYEK